MKKLNTINNVSKFLVRELDCYYESDKMFFLNGKIIQKLENNFFGEFYLNGDNLIIQSFYGTFFYKNYQIEGYYNYFNDKEVEYINKENGNLYIEYNEGFVKTLLRNNAYHVNDYYTVFENVITSYETIFPNIQMLWRFNLEKKYNWEQRADYIDEPAVEKQAEVIKFLGGYKNELWLILNNGALLALNIETGKETRYIKEGKMIIGESDFEDFKGNFGYDTILDKENGLIFNLSRYFYIEFNLNSNKEYFNSYSFKESSINHKLNLNYIGGYDTESIFAYEGSDNNCFAVFSRQKKEIVLSKEIKEVKNKFPAIRDMKYAAGKIYVLDHNNTLHLFNKE